MRNLQIAEKLFSQIQNSRMMSFCWILSPDHLSFKVPAVKVAAQTSTTDAGIQGELDQNTLGARLQLVLSS